MAQQNVNTAAHESTETLFLTTRNVAYLHIRENLYQHVETGIIYTASSEGRLFDPTDFREVTTDGQRVIKADEREVQEPAEKEQNDFTDAVSHFKTSTHYNALIQGDDQYSGKLAAKNIRIELKTSFKGIKFSVRKNHFDSLSVSWTDGPQKENVEAITSKYNVGRFDVYQDYHYADVSAFNEVFGGADYINLTREYSDELIHEAIGILVDKYEHHFKNEERPTVEDYRKGRLWNKGLEFYRRSLHHELSEILWEL